MISQMFLHDEACTYITTCNRLDDSPPNRLMAQSPEPVNVSLSGKKDFADMIKLRILRGRLSGLVGWPPSGPSVRDGEKSV